MARPLRVEYEGAYYHVMNRGNGRRRVFHTDRDYELFLEKLGQAAETFRVSLRAFCLMPNHFHLYLATPQANLSRFMQSLLTAFTVSLNRRRRSSGHVFQGRFKAVLVEDEAYGQAVGRYVELNPVRVAGARGAPLEQRRQALRGYRWSSYGSLIGVRACPSWLDRDAVLAAWGRSRRGQGRAYAAFVEEGLLEELPNPLSEAAAQVVLGRETFVEWVRGRFLQLSGSARARRERGQAHALASWASVDDVVACVAEEFGAEREELLRRWNRNHAGRQALLYLACRHCRGRYTLTELGGHLGGVTLGALSRAQATVSGRLGRDRDLRRRVARVEAMLREKTEGYNCKE